MITQNELKSILSYDPDTGVFTWLETGKGRRPDKKAGNQLSSGYIQLVINYKKYYAHRLAWLYVTGEWPENEIDHKDTIKNNNKWENLREATSSQNQHNRTYQVNNKFNLKGVRKHRNRYYATIWINNERIHLGSFLTPEEASLAYSEAADKLHKEFKRL